MKRSFCLIGINAVVSILSIRDQRTTCLYDFYQLDILEIHAIYNRGYW